MLLFFRNIETTNQKVLLEFLLSEKKRKKVKKTERSMEVQRISRKTQLVISREGLNLVCMRQNFNFTVRQISVT